MSSDRFHGRPIQPFEYAIRRGFGISGFSASYASTTNVLKIIIAGNVLVFGGWILGEQTRNFRLLRQLTDSFTLSLRNLKEHRYYVLLTSAFSHRDLVHIGFNMANLWTFGTLLGYMGVGGIHTAGLCLASGIVGSAAWAYHHAFIKPNPTQDHVFGSRVIRSKDMDTALGASGMVMGAGAAAACLAPFTSMNLMFIPIPIPLWAIVCGYFAIDAFYLNTGKIIGHSAHLGGAVTGVAYYLLTLRGYGGVWRMLARRLR